MFLLAPLRTAGVKPSLIRSPCPLPHCGLSSPAPARGALLAFVPARQRRTEVMMAASAASGPKKVLITNDDGPGSPFFPPFVERLRTLTGWDCTVVIPDGQQSFVGKSISRSPMEVKEVAEKEFHLPASPASCVNLALYHLCTDVDFVISGPNVGHNSGRAAVLSSGTVGAALEGAIAKRRAVAISFPFFNGFNNWSEEEIDAAVDISVSVVAKLWAEWPGGVEVFNVNVPLGAGVHVGAEVRSTFLETSADYGSLFKLSAENEGTFEWGPSGIRAFDGTDLTEGSDVHAVKEGVVSVTPLLADMRPGAGWGGH